MSYFSFFKGKNYPTYYSPFIKYVREEVYKGTVKVKSKAYAYWPFTLLAIQVLSL